jgi:hypothetical protein
LPSFFGFIDLNFLRVNFKGLRASRSCAINQRGSGSITIQANELKAGMYLYTLIADGAEVGTKKMILTK